MFEISYGFLFRSGMQKHNLIVNSNSLVQATLGKGLILSSGARNVMELRETHSVFNLGTAIFNMNQELARSAVCRASQDAVAHGKLRKASKGAVEVIENGVDENKMDQT